MTNSTIQYNTVQQYTGHWDMIHIHATLTRDLIQRQRDKHSSLIIKWSSRGNSTAETEEVRLC